MREMAGLSGAPPRWTPDFTVRDIPTNATTDPGGTEFFNRGASELCRDAFLDSDMDEEARESGRIRTETTKLTPR
ncbi:hypothetical protein HAHE_29410 [Haloferula helveola]|uniref:Uncharacterized protein n=1 Tax=Haloferula helveola TaxID=490095 RepID=A0ABM7RME7_9BACT|nr:hypothetical protein HAHE_29410 [Haloferula helveola]